MLDTIVNYLPEAWRPKAKGIVAAAGAVLTVLSIVITDSPRWLTVALAAFTALGVYQTPAPGYNEPTAGEGA